MKKTLLFCFVMMMIVVWPKQADASERITIIVNEQILTPPADPIILNGRTMVPLRAICEALGCDVGWNEEYQTAKISHPVSTINMTIGSYWFKKNSLLDGSTNVEVQMDVPPIIYEGSTMVPVRALAEAVNATVGWDEKTQTVRITLYEYDSYYVDDGWAKVKKAIKSSRRFMMRIGTLTVSLPVCAWKTSGGLWIGTAPL